MLAQAGMDQLVGPLIAPCVIVWLLAVGLLAALAFFGVFLALIRAFHQWRDPEANRGEIDQGESRTPKPARGTTF